MPETTDVFLKIETIYICVCFCHWSVFSIAFLQTF